MALWDMKKYSVEGCWERLFKELQQIKDNQMQLAYAITEVESSITIKGAKR